MMMMMRMMLIVMVGGSFADVVDCRRAIGDNDVAAVAHITFGWVIVWQAFARSDGYDEFMDGFTIFTTGHFHDWGKKNRFN